MERCVRRVFVHLEDIFCKREEQGLRLQMILSSSRKLEPRLSRPLCWKLDSSCAYPLLSESFFRDVHCNSGFLSVYEERTVDNSLQHDFRVRANSALCCFSFKTRPAPLRNGQKALFFLLEPNKVSHFHTIRFYKPTWKLQNIARRHFRRKNCRIRPGSDLVNHI